MRGRCASSRKLDHGGSPEDPSARGSYPLQLCSFGGLIPQDSCAGRRYLEGPKLDALIAVINGDASLLDGRLLYNHPCSRLPTSDAKPLRSTRRHWLVFVMSLVFAEASIARLLQPLRPDLIMQRWLTSPGAALCHASHTNPAAEVTNSFSLRVPLK